MSISDRLDEIQGRYGDWYGDRGRHTPAPDTMLWRLADHPDESMDHCIVRNDVPAMYAALRAVLDVCDEVEDQHHPDQLYESGMEEMAHRVRVAIDRISRIAYPEASHE